MGLADGIILLLIAAVLLIAFYRNRKHPGCGCGSCEQCRGCRGEKRK